MNTLQYGLRATPDDIAAAWGARLIFPNDLVWDRTDMFGEQTDKDALLDWLNGNAPDIRTAEFASIVRINTRSTEEHVFTIYEDEHGIMQGSAQGSCGYLYVAAWLKP